MVDESIIEACDPGIRDVVRLLMAAGFETTDSGDGVSKGDTMDCALPVPNVAAVTDRARLFTDADRMQALLDAHEAGWIVEATYLAGQGGVCVLLATHQPELTGGA